MSNLVCSLFGLLQNTIVRSYVRTYVNRMKQSIFTLVALATLGLTQPALGVIIVHFVTEPDQGSGVGIRVSFSGTIQVKPDLATSPSSFSAIGGVVGPNYHFALSGDIYAAGGVGTAASGIVTAHIGGTSEPGAGLGFEHHFLYWNARTAGGGYTGGPVSSLTADPTIDTTLFVSHTLDTMNVEAKDIAEGTTLWTANGTGDRFIFSRVAPVPEPSTYAAISGLVCLGGAIARRRFKRS